MPKRPPAERPAAKLQQDATPDHIAPIPDTFDDILRVIVTASLGQVEERLQAEDSRR